MNIEKIQDVRKDIDNTYELINELASNHSLEMIDLVYPKHDGKQDADAVAELMMLRQCANSLSNACQLLITKLTDADIDK